MSNTYKAVEIKEYGSQSDPATGIAIAERPVPAPGAGEVLVRLYLRPINPSDLMSLAGAAALLSCRDYLIEDGAAAVVSKLHVRALHPACRRGGIITSSCMVSAPHLSRDAAAR